jgi:hypothetical protein
VVYYCDVQLVELCVCHYAQLIKVKETGSDDVGWIHLAQGRIHSWALVIMKMNFKFHKRWNFFTS